MEAPLGSAADQVTRLRDCLNDLLSITALPALSTGGEPGQIARPLLDALLGTLRLAFVLCAVQRARGWTSIEIIRVAESLAGQDESERSARPSTRRWATRPLKGSPAARVFIGDVDLSVASAHLGLRGENDVLIAGFQRRDFPSETERLLLYVAANQAAIGLRHARLLSEQKHPPATSPTRCSANE